MTGGHKTAWLNLQIAAVFEKIFKGEWVNSSYKQHCFKHNCVIMCDTVTKFNDECMMSKFSMFSNNYTVTINTVRAYHSIYHVTGPSGINCG